MWFKTLQKWIDDYDCLVHVVSMVCGLGMHPEWTDGGGYVVNIVSKVCGLNHADNGVYVAYVVSKG